MGNYSDGDGRVPVGPLSRNLTNEVNKFSNVAVCRHGIYCMVRWGRDETRLVLNWMMSAQRTWLGMAVVGSFGMWTGRISERYTQ